VGGSPSDWRWARAVISTISCTAGGSWAGSRQYQELALLLEALNQAIIRQK